MINKISHSGQNNNGYYILDILKDCNHPGVWLRPWPGFGAQLIPQPQPGRATGQNGPAGACPLGRGPTCADIFIPDHLAIPLGGKLG
jgi:hypothetical protein